jgi:RNA polymerase sigma-70 factor (ECF subfamily)
MHARNLEAYPGVAWSRSFVLPGREDSGRRAATDADSPNRESLGDAELMLLFQRGDRGAYECLVVRHLAFVVRHARRYLRDDAGAEDVAQEVFLRLFRSVKQFRDPSNFIGWLTLMTTRLSLNELRTRTRKRWFARSQLANNHGTGDSQAGREWRSGESAGRQPDIGGEDLLLQAELFEQLHAAIAALPERQRLAVELQSFEEWGLERIGAVLEMSVPAVKSLLHRARANLLEKLQNYLEEPQPRFGQAAEPL